MKSITITEEEYNELKRKARLFSELAEALDEYYYDDTGDPKPGASYAGLGEIVGDQWGYFK